MFVVTLSKQKATGEEQKATGEAKPAEHDDDSTYEHDDNSGDYVQPWQAVIITVVTE